jgi:hypothetical protein
MRFLLNKFLLINFYGKKLGSNKKHYYEANIYTFIYMFDIDLFFIHFNSTFIIINNINKF